MLAEKILDEAGAITSRRVLPSTQGSAKMEISCQVQGRLLGTDYNGVYTYAAVQRSDAGAGLYGEGQGILMTKDGDVITWTGTGLGKPTGRGMSSSWRGSIFFRTASPKFSRLDGVCGVFEHEVDEDGKIRDSVWEWR